MPRTCQLSRFEDLVYTAGQPPLVDGTFRAVGKVGTDGSVDDAVECARIAALNGLAAVVDLTGDLDVITRIVKVVVYVASVRSSLISRWLLMARVGY